jgi:hypothetical protein
MPPMTITYAPDYVLHTEIKEIANSSKLQFLRWNDLKTQEIQISKTQVQNIFLTLPHVKERLKIQEKFHSM